MKTRAEATRLLHQGLRDSEVARRTGYSRERIRQFRAALQLPKPEARGNCPDRPPRARKPMRPDVLETVQSLRAAGWPETEIQRHVAGWHVGTAHVRAAIKAYDAEHPLAPRVRHPHDWLRFDWTRCNACVAREAQVPRQTVATRRCLLGRAGHVMPDAPKGAKKCGPACAKRERQPGSR